jgi:ribosome modulation factor
LNDHQIGLNGRSKDQNPTLDTLNVTPERLNDHQIGLSGRSKDQNPTLDTLNVTPERLNDHQIGLNGRPKDQNVAFEALNDPKNQLNSHLTLISGFLIAGDKWNKEEMPGPGFRRPRFFSICLINSRHLHLESTCRPRKKIHFWKILSV